MYWMHVGNVDCLKKTFRFKSVLYLHFALAYISPKGIKQQALNIVRNKL